MQRARSGDRNLGKQFRFASEKIEIGDIHRMRPAHAAFDERNGLLSPPRTGCPALDIGTRNGIDAQLAKLSVKKL
jgi:hypothetical protein